MEHQPTRPLDQKVVIVIVTGAGSGIGRAAAAALARAGAHVLGVGRRQDALDETATLHPLIANLAIDICTDEAPARIVQEALERWQRIDVLVNNAGKAARLTLDEVTRSRVTDLLDLNVVAPTMLAREVLPHLRRSRGSIINISSTYGRRPQPGVAYYAASKAAIEQLTRNWALELTGDGIRVNCVAPGPTESEAQSASGLSEETVTKIKQDQAARIPLGRRGEPDEIAPWIVQFADPQATWITGQVLTVDGRLELI